MELIVTNNMHLTLNELYVLKTELEIMHGKDLSKQRIDICESILVKISKTINQLKKNEAVIDLSKSGQPTEAFMIVENVNGYKNVYPENKGMEIYLNQKTVCNNCAMMATKEYLKGPDHYYCTGNIDKGYIKDPNNQSCTKFKDYN